MSNGDKWAAIGMCQMEKASSFALMNAFYGAGGNFIDTSNNYQDETSEVFIVEWIAERGMRDQMVIATKARTLRVREVTEPLSFSGTGGTPRTTSALMTSRRRSSVWAVS